MLKCREVSELASAIIDQNLSMRTRLAVLAHLSLCRHCRLYLRQLRLTAETLRRLPAEPEADARAILEAIRRRERGGE